MIGEWADRSTEDSASFAKLTEAIAFRGALTPPQSNALRLWRGVAAPQVEGVSTQRAATAPQEGAFSAQRAATAPRVGAFSTQRAVTPLQGLLPQFWRGDGALQTGNTSKPT